MATLQKLRSKGALLVTVIFAALAAFILGDFLKSGSSIMQRRQMEIAEIEGEAIKYPDFQAKFEEALNIQKQNSGSNAIDEATYQRVLNQTWDALVKEQLLGDIFDDEGIKITSAEMFDMVQGNNLHPNINQLFADPNTGQVDRTSILRFLKYIQENPDAPQRANWLSIEKQIMLDKKEKKYDDLVAKGLYVNSLQAKVSLVEKNRTVDLKFIQKKITDVSDSAVTVTDSDLKKYYAAHKEEDYKQEETRKIQFVTFDIAPSAEDDKDAMAWIENLKSGFEKAEDNVRYVNRNSDTRFEDVYQTESMLNPEIADFAFDAEIGEVYGPVKEGNFYKLYKLNDIKMLPDSVKASHILIRINNESDVQFASDKLDSLQKVIESGQTTFEQIAKDNSDDGSASLGGDLGWFAHGRMVPEFEKAAFRAEKGELVKVQTQFGYHLIQVKEQGPKAKNVQLAVVDREIIPSNATTQNLYAETSTFAAQSGDFDGFMEQVKELGLQAKEATLKIADRNIIGIGAARSIVRAVFFDSEEGDLVRDRSNAVVFELNDQYIVAVIETVTEEGYREFADKTLQAELKIAVLKEKKKELLKTQFAAAKAETIEATAQALGLEVQDASGFKANYGQLNAVGMEQAINGAVAALEQGQLSEPIVGNKGIYFVVLTNIDDNTAENIEAEKQSLYKSSGYRVSYQAYNTIKEESEIIDKRANFY